MHELSHFEFDVLLAIAVGEAATQRQIIEYCPEDISLGSVNKALHSLREANYVEGMTVTEAGRAALEPYRVQNAIVMAAGLSSRFVPISYEKPKGVLKVRGEVLIERQIEQLQAAGITDITVVVGYKREHYFYLGARYGVDIVVNPDYATRNNNSTLMMVADRLSNTYICSSDNYFEENPFEQYVYKAYYAGQYSEGPTDEYCMITGAHNRIAAVTYGGCDDWYMIGHAYFDRAFSEHFVEILREEYDRPETADKLWERIYGEHVKEFDMVMRPYSPDIIYEFDSLDELREFDPFFLENVDSEVFDNIVSVLGCEKSEIHDIYPLKQGLTNLSCHFAVGGNEYVYRHPGVGTEQLIDRTAEHAALLLARDLGLDSTFIHGDPEAGWKISRFIPNCKNLDPHDDEQLCRAMQMAARLHEEKVTLDRHFDFYEEGKGYEQNLLEFGRIDVTGYAEMAADAEELHRYVVADNAPQCVTHNDFFYLNFLIDEQGDYSLIDWEYAGMGDYANDFGTFTVCCELSDVEARRALQHYFGREANDAELRHNFAHIALAGWCWYVWSLVKEAQSDHVGEWLYIYYRYAAEYMKRALDMYRAAEGAK